MDEFVVVFRKPHQNEGNEYVCIADDEAAARRQFWAWCEKELHEPFTYVVKEVRRVALPDTDGADWYMRCERCGESIEDCECDDNGNY